MYSPNSNTESILQNNILKIIVSKVFSEKYSPIIFTESILYNNILQIIMSKVFSLKIFSEFGRLLNTARESGSAGKIISLGRTEA